MTAEEELPSLVVLASPYEGALYWMFEETRCNPEHQLSNPYYAGLYGQKAAERAFRSQAAAAICLFEDVLLVGANALVPMGMPTMRITVAEDDDWVWRDCRKEIIKAISRLQIFAHFMKRHAKALSNVNDFELFADRALMHLGSAEVEGATLLGGGMFAEFCALLDASVPFLGDLETRVPARPFGKIVNPGHLDVYGINFSPPDLGAFTSVRSDQVVKEYGRQFCHALLKVADPIEREREFVRTIRTALDYEAISKRTAGVLETTASASGVAGLVPLLGIVPGIAGVVADASARSARLAERKSRWPLVGVRMQEIATRDFLKRKENM